jgi:glutamate N-acetyltransferase/amino-acid N-acetyltransferase
MIKSNINGFQAAGLSCGLKKNANKDLGLIVSSVPAHVAGVFTRNRVQAAPVVLARERAGTGICRALIVNSGNANCCTGARGLQDAREMTRLVAEAIDVPQEQVLVASTGVIGEPLPIAKVAAAIPRLLESCRGNGWEDLAEAIMTTDTVPKIALGGDRVGANAFHVLGIAKGAGMIRPDMATMLCFVVSDVQVSPDRMQAMLQQAVDRSFNRITIDGDTSTNDTVLFLANGVSGAVVDTLESQSVLQNVLDAVLLDLARMCVKDGEGATKLVEITVRGAGSDRDGRLVADTVANSSLVKTALFGEDANWGRILAAAGRSGVPIEPNRVDIYFDDVAMVKGGAGCGKTVEAAATAVLKKPEFTITIDLHMGAAEASVITCDLSVDYVKINADYRS